MADLPSIAAHDAEPLTAVNDPFLSWIRYRADDYSTTRHKLLEHLAEAFERWNPDLADGEGERDLGVAFVELYAYLAEILSFYQDCRANEAFLRTATLPASLIELCALIDYRLLPGASASTLQVFLLKEGESGQIPKGFQVKTEARGDKPALVFETGADLEADAARNRLRLAGWNRSSRTINGPVPPPRSDALLDDGYDGLKAGGYVVFDASDAGGARFPAQLTAVAADDDKRRIVWEPSSGLAAADPAIADLVIHGKPQQAMALAARERADEITAGQRVIEVESTGIFAPGRAMLFASEGLLLPARVLSVDTGNQRVTLYNGLGLSLRKSATTLYKGVSVGSWNQPLRRGATRIPRTDIEKEHSFDPEAGDHLLLSDASGVERVTAVASDALSITLAEPLPRAFRPFRHPGDSVDRIRYFRVRLPGPGISGASTSTTLRPLLAGDADGVVQSGSTTALTLDATYEGLEEGELVVVADGHRAAQVFAVAGAEVDELERTVLTLEGAVAVDFRVAATALHGPFEHRMRVDGHDRSEGTLPAGSTRLVLDGVVAGLKPAGYLVVEGGGHAEGVRITAVTYAGGDTEVDLEEALAHAYPEAATVIYGNVAPVTHGETVEEELLGSGDHSEANQRFSLGRKPTTWVHDAEGWRGIANTLELFVAGERWREAASLAERGGDAGKPSWLGAGTPETGPEDRRYAVEIDEDQRMTVVTGDGRYGATLVTGRDNVRARYRVGLGADGNVDAEAVAKIAKSVSFLDRTRNPVAAAGGQDRETVAEAKRLAPITVRTLDRAVSLSDYADLALAYAGIAKARADWEWEGLQRVVVLTVAAAGGQPLTLTLKNALRGYLDARRTPERRLSIRDHRRVPVRLELTVHVKADFLRMETQERVERALGPGLDDDGERAFFHFDRLGLGQDLYLSEVYARIEAVRGVDFVVARAFHPEGAPPAGGAPMDRVPVPVDAVATGGDPADATVGILKVESVGGIV